MVSIISSCSRSKDPFFISLVPPSSSFPLFIFVYLTVYLSFFIYLSLPIYLCLSVSLYSCIPLFPPASNTKDSKMSVIYNCSASAPSHLFSTICLLPYHNSLRLLLHLTFVDQTLSRRRIKAFAFCVPSRADVLFPFVHVLPFSLVASSFIFILAISSLSSRILGFENSLLSRDNAGAVSDNIFCIA